MLDNPPCHTPVVKVALHPWQKFLTPSAVPVGGQQSSLPEVLWVEIMQLLGHFSDFTDVLAAADKFFLTC